MPKLIAAQLELPYNAMLLYQPSYSPEVNPIEQIWAWAKGKIAAVVFESVEALKECASDIMADAGNAIFKSIVHRGFILRALGDAGIMVAMENFLYIFESSIKINDLPSMNGGFFMAHYL